MTTGRGLRHREANASRTHWAHVFQVWLHPSQAVLGGLKLVLHLGINLFGGYEIFRDELYYLACADHPALGYVDHPPLSIWLLAGVRAILGDSLFAIRLLPAVAGALLVVVTGLLARELGGGRFAVTVAALCPFVAGEVLALSSFWSMNVFDLLFVALAALSIARLATTQDSRYWIAIGGALGLGLLNKAGVLWVGLGVAVGLLATRERRWLRTPWPWAGGALAGLVFLPYVLWNAGHDWAHLEFIESVEDIGGGPPPDHVDRRRRTRRHRSSRHPCTSARRRRSSKPRSAVEGSALVGFT